MQTHAFVAAIVGRPNVGKSTLFNRLVGRRAALVHGTAGTTRDRREGDARLYDLAFRVFDTAGLEDSRPDAITARIVGQTLKAAAGADLILFMIDARAGVTALDRDFARRLRKLGKPIVLLANKCESRAGDPGVAEAHALGFGAPVAISAEHGLGLADLHEALSAFVPRAPGRAPDAAPEAAESGDGVAEEVPPPRSLALAVVGQPNAGKSTLVNRLLGEERVIVGPEPGLTRDAIDLEWRWRGRDITLVDTAGLRRRAKVVDPLERLAAFDAGRAIARAHVVILLVDALTVQDFGRGLEKQDLRIAERVEAEGRALVVALNKWDRIAEPSKQLRLVRDSLDESLAQLRSVPVVAISALEGTGLDRLMATVLAVEAAWNSRIGTAKLNRWLMAATEANPPPLARGRRVKLRYATQLRARPPSFVVFANLPEQVPEAYRRYLANGLRDALALAGVPVRLEFRAGENPYARRK